MTSPIGDEPDTIEETPPHPTTTVDVHTQHPDQPAATALDGLDPHRHGLADQAATVSDTARHLGRDHRHALTDLRQRVRRELANAVLDGHLDPDHANTICDSLDIERLPLQWRIQMTMTVRCTVSAVADSEALDLAETLIAGAIDDNSSAIEISFDHRHDALAEPDGIDADAIDASIRR